MNMNQVEVKKVIRVKPWQVIRFMTHVEEFPKFMPNVKETCVLERSSKEATTCWSVEFNKIPLSWKQKEEYDLKKGLIRFYATEGDLKQFDGEWTFKAHQEGTEVFLKINFGIGIPMVENLIGTSMGLLIKSNFEKMLDAIEERHRMQDYKNIRYRSFSKLNGFAVIGHPYNFQHLVRYFKHLQPDIELPSKEVVEKLFELTPAYKSFDVKDYTSKTGKKTRGYFIMCPIIPDMVALNPERVVEKVVQACKVAENLGVGIVTLGGFTSIAGERYGKALSSAINIPVTTGNTFTVTLTIDGILKAAKLMGIDLPSAKVTVIGGGGDIGGACARILSQKVKQVTITGRNEKNLMENERLLAYFGSAKVDTSTNNNEAIADADIVLAAASTAQSVIDFNRFKPGAVVCDVGYPKNISYTECQRKDILIFSGGIAKLPMPFDLGFDIGMPSNEVLYGCFSECVILDLEERYENYSWGKGNMTLEKIDFMREIGKKHGFELAPFFWGNRLLKDEEIESIRREVSGT